MIATVPCDRCNRPVFTASGSDGKPVRRDADSRHMVWELADSVDALVARSVHPQEIYVEHAALCRGGLAQGALSL